MVQLRQARVLSRCLGGACSGATIAVWMLVHCSVSQFSYCPSARAGWAAVGWAQKCRLWNLTKTSRFICGVKQLLSCESMAWWHLLSSLCWQSRLCWSLQELCSLGLWNGLPGLTRKGAAFHSGMLQVQICTLLCKSVPCRVPNAAGPVLCLQMWSFLLKERASLGLGKKLGSPNNKVRRARKILFQKHCFAELMLKETLLKIPHKYTCLVDHDLGLMSCLERNVLCLLWEN